MVETVEYAQERYREQVAHGLDLARLEQATAAAPGSWTAWMALARLEQAREVEQRATDVRRAGRVRRALARALVALANALAAPEPQDTASV